MLELHWLQISPYYDSRVISYDRKMFIRLATGVPILDKAYICAYFMEYV